MSNILRFTPRPSAGALTNKPGARKNMNPQVEGASKLSYRNHDQIREGAPCGCYFCLHVFDGGAVTEWTDAGQTALCPRCDIDAVLPGVTDASALQAAHESWFCRPADEEALQGLKDLAGSQ